MRLIMPTGNSVDVVLGATLAASNRRSGIIGHQRGGAKRRAGAAQPLVMLAKQVVDRTQIPQHLDVMFTICAELNFVDADSLFGLEKPLLQRLEDLRQPVVDVRVGPAPRQPSQHRVPCSERVIYRAR